MNCSWLLQPSSVQIISVGILTYVLYALLSVTDYYKGNVHSKTIMSICIISILYAVSQSILWMFVVLFFTPDQVTFSFGFTVAMYHSIIALLMLGAYYYSVIVKFNRIISVGMLTIMLSSFPIYLVCTYMEQSLTNIIIVIGLIVIVSAIAGFYSVTSYRKKYMRGYKWRAVLALTAAIATHNVMIDFVLLNRLNKKLGLYELVKVQSMVLVLFVILLMTVVMHWWYGRKLTVRTYHVYRQFVEQFMDTMAIIKGDRFDYINPSGLRLFEVIGTSDLLGKSVYSFIDEKDKEKLHQWLNRDCTAINDSIELRWRTMSNRVIHTEVTIILCNSAKETYRQIWMKDIMVQKQEEELKLQAAKLSAASQIAAGIAHEIRNPLTSVKGFLQLMMSGHIHKKKYYSIMDKELKDIEGLINSMLMLSQPLKHEFMRTDIGEVMRSALDRLDAKLENKKITVDVRMAKQPIIVSGVHNQLQQVFMHIVEHGIVTMHEGGTIMIQLYIDHNDEAMVIIQDEGGGISEEQLARIGEPHYITVEEGTGIELMIAYKIVENHRGRIKVESTEGYGTIFAISLPRIHT